MYDHLTDNQIARYRENRLLSQEWLEVGAHVSSCEWCRLRVREERREEWADSAVAALLPEWTEDDEEAVHLEYEEMSAYVNGGASDVVRGIVETHVQTCDACDALLRDLRAFHVILSGYPPESLEPKRPTSLWDRFKGRSPRPAQLQAAFGEGAAEDVAECSFPILHEGNVVEDLLGVMFRHGSAYYVRIETRDDRAEAAYENRSVSIHIPGPVEGQPDQIIIQQIEDVTLIGTELYSEFPPDADQMPEGTLLSASALPDSTFESADNNADPE
jgi:hypothetical protein